MSLEKGKYSLIEDQYYLYTYTYISLCGVNDFIIIKKLITFNLFKTNLLQLLFYKK